MSDSEYSEHKSKNSFDENEESEIDNRDKLFKGMVIELYQFKRIKNNYEKSQERSSQTQKENIFLFNYRENLWVRKTEWCTCNNCRAESQEIDCIYRREGDAISDEQFSGNICDVLHKGIKYLYFIDIIVIN